MAILITYSIAEGTLNGAVDLESLREEIIADGTVVTGFTGVGACGDSLRIMGASLADEPGLAALVASHDHETTLTDILKGSGDYKARRKSIIIDVATRGFSNLNPREKKLASEHFAVAKADRDTVHTMEEQVTFGTKFHIHSIESRDNRRLSAVGEVYNRLTSGTDQMDLMADVSGLLEQYVKYGIEGTLEGDIEGLFDYIEGRTGTTWETTGLPSKTGYTIEGMTLTQLKDRLMDILANGNY